MKSGKKFRGRSVSDFLPGHSSIIITFDTVYGASGSVSSARIPSRCALILLDMSLPRTDEQ